MSRKRDKQSWVGWLGCSRVGCGAEAEHKIWFHDGTTSNLCVGHARDAIKNGGTKTPAGLQTRDASISTPVLNRNTIEAMSSDQLKRLMAHEPTRLRIEKTLAGRS